MFTDGEKPDTFGIERAIAGVFSAARHPTRRNLKRGMEGTPGRVYLCGGGSLRLLANRICKGSDRHIGRIKHLVDLTCTKDRIMQVLVVESVLRRMVDRGDLWYSGDSWYADEEFLRRQKQYSDILRVRSRHMADAGMTYQRQPVQSLVLENA